MKATRFAAPSASLMLMIVLAAQAAPGEKWPREASEQAHFELELVAEDLAFGWDISFLPSGQMLISEFDGGLWVFPEGGGEPTLITAIPNVADTGGFRGVEPHPDFENNGLLYFCYTVGTEEASHARVARATFDGESVGELDVIFDADNAAMESAHVSCRLLWLPDGTLLVTLGDRRHHLDKAQSLNNHYGTPVRLNDDGSVPADNPFVATEGARPEIWAYGVRNAQGADFHPETGEIWFAEHGPLGGDEINILKPGRNYGWPVATYGIDYNRDILTDTPVRPDVKPPLWYWRPSIAPSAVAFYTGDEFPQWRGDLFVAALARQRLLRLELQSDRIVGIEELLEEPGVRLRDVTMGPDGSMYVLTDPRDSKLYRIVPAATDD